MKVLILEDSQAITDALSETLMTNDHSVESASTADEAVIRWKAFRPEVIILDAAVQDCEKLFDALDKDIMRLRPKVLMLVKDDDILSDIPVYRRIRKPFKGIDILDAMKSDVEEGEKDKGAFLKNILGKLHSPKAEDEGGMELRFGRSYLFLENGSLELRKACRQFADRGDDILYITSGKIKAVKETVKRDITKVYALSEKENEDHISGSKIGSVTNAMTSFINTAKRPVVAIDDLETLIRLNDLNSVLTMIEQTVNNGSGKPMTMMASVSPEKISERDKGMLLKNLTEYEK